MRAIDTGSAVPAWKGAHVASLIASVLLGLLLVVLFARSAQIAVGNPPSFDGAMNLQVASSIAHGEGYRRSYAAREPVPHEIQTGPPYILPAAAVFRIWGVGIPQAEVVNIAYLALLLAAVYWLTAPMGGRLLALFAACTVMVVPGIHQYGFFGYGEIPTLALALAATVAYFHREGNWHWGFAAGLLLALAVYTKTVMLIGAGALGLCALLEMITNRSSRGSSSARRIVAFLAGGISLVVIMESLRALALGGVHVWRAWWETEAGSIFRQAGVEPGLGGDSHSLLHKFGIHFGLLGHDYRMSLVLTGLWLILLFACMAWQLLRVWRRRSVDWRTLTVLLMAGVYLGWWLCLTPTTKAWHRRIIDGMIAADVGMIMLAAGCLGALRAVPGIRRRILIALIAGMTLVLPAMWLVKGTHTLLFAPVSDKVCGWRMADASDCARFNPGASVAALQRVAHEVHALPADAYVFGFGWYSAPRIGLFAQRHILDFHAAPVKTLQPSRPVYFVHGPDTPPAALQRIRTLYHVSPTPDYAYALIHAISLTPRPLVPGTAPVLRHLKAADQYAYLEGFNQSEGANGRWLTDDNQVLLLPQAGDVFELTAYVVPATQYDGQRAPNVFVSFNGCVAPEKTTQPGQVNHMVFVVPARCEAVAGKPVTVRIEVDNLVDSSVTHDARALGILAKSFGFVPPDPAASGAANGGSAD
ncbi:MAG TPA: hypothetical protein VFJ87_09425 [Rhodanobacteraceae bacterium]|nr:hypothetical protein [Rhodanobacteraceae bacterium]